MFIFYLQLGSLVTTGIDPVPTSAPMPTRVPLESSNLVHNHPVKDNTMVKRIVVYFSIFGCKLKKL